MNWPLAIRKLCEAYWGTTPADYENLTYDQILIMALPEEQLKHGGKIARGTASELASAGLIPHREGPRKLDLILAGIDPDNPPKTKRERRRARIQAMRQQRGLNGN